MLSAILICSISNIFGQKAEIKSVQYVNTEILVPGNYTAQDEYSIESDFFSAQWLYLSKEMVEQGIEKEIIRQFEDQLKYSKTSAVSFVSNGGYFTGKQYELRRGNNFKFKVLAFGVVDKQPLILNLGFKAVPKTDGKSDDLMKIFIQWE